MAARVKGDRPRRRAAIAAMTALALWAAAAVSHSAVDVFAEQRRRMVEEQIVARGVRQREVLAAMSSVPRHVFVPDDLRSQAYDDRPLPIGHGQTISQPYIVALMTSLLELDKKDRVLEIGTGSGYQAAVLSRVAGEVRSIEILPALGNKARETLEREGYGNVEVRIGDGYKGWQSAAPFDAIILTAAPPQIPKPLLEQLKPGGKMVLPVGETLQDLLVLTKRQDGTFEKRKVLPVRFVPMTGEAQARRQK